MSLLSDEAMIDLAGAAAFARGRAYFSQGLVQLLCCELERIEGRAFGQAVYGLSLRFGRGAWSTYCECPAFREMRLCKHLVAAMMVARATLQGASPADANIGDRPAPAPAPRSKAAPAKPKRGTATVPRSSAGKLEEFLRAQPAARLADWLEEFADSHPQIERALSMRQAMEDPIALKKALGKMLRPPHLDYYGSRRYAGQLQPGIEALRALGERDPAQCRTLSEYFLGRALTHYARSDDSDGGIGECIREVAALHAQACAAVLPGKTLLKPLLALMDKDDWGLFPIDAYWAALGDGGQQAYGQMLSRQWQVLPAKPKESDRREETVLSRRMEAYARSAGDSELLLRVLRRRLHYEVDYLHLAETLGEMGREREQTALLEDAVRRFPTGGGVRSALAASLDRSGLREEALSYRWEAFCLRQGAEQWDALKHAAGTQWPQWRARAMDQFPQRRDGDRSELVTMLMHDGDLVAATEITKANPVHIETLKRLADAVRQTEPLTAAEFYWRVASERLAAPIISASRYAEIADLLAKACTLLPPADAAARIDAIRARHQRKTNLMAALSRRGL